MNFTAICMGCGKEKKQNGHEGRKIWLRRKFCSHPCSLEYNKRNKVGFFGTWGSGKFHATAQMRENIEKAISNALPHD